MVRAKHAWCREAPASVWLTPTVSYINEYELTALGTSALLEELAKLVADKERGVTPTHIYDRYLPRGRHASNTKLRMLHHEGVGGQYLLVRKEPAAMDEPGHWNKTTLVLDAKEMSLIASSHDERCHELAVLKDRYKVKLSGCMAHVYVYMGELYGLVTVSFKGLADAKYRSDLRSYIEEGARHTHNQLSQMCIDLGDQEFDFNGCKLAGVSYRELDWQLQSFGYTKLDPAKYGLSRR